MGQCCTTDTKTNRPQPFQQQQPQPVQQQQQPQPFQQQQRPQPVQQQQQPQPFQQQQRPQPVQQQQQPQPVQQQQRPQPAEQQPQPVQQQEVQSAGQEAQSSAKSGPKDLQWRDCEERRESELSYSAKRLGLSSVSDVNGDAQNESLMHGESLATGHACVGSAEADLTPPRNVSRGSNEDGCSADDKDSSECRTSSQVGECSDLTVEGKSASAVVHTMPLRNRGTHSHEGSSSDGGNNCENVYGDSCFVTARSLPGLSVSCTPRTRGVWAGDAVSDGDLTARGFFRSCRSEESAPCSGRWESSSGEGTLGERFHRTIVNNFKIRLPWGLLNASSVEVPMSPTMPSCTSTPRRVVASSCFEDSQCTARDTPLHSLVTSVKFVYDEGSSVTESLPRSSRVPMDYGGGVSARSIAMSDDFRSCQSLAGESAVQSARPSHTNTPGMSSSVTCLTAREGGERDIIAQNNSFDSVVVQQQEDLDTRDQFLGKPSLGFVLRGISRLQNFITLSYGKSNNAGAVEDLLLPEKSDKSFMGFGAVKPLLVASQNKENSAINKILI